ncbi:UNVERIFIED_CONTAM: alkanesulfonate monooxygenase SsuD/methylene tetrahydromethanopterin reductase-like flavin-dependent oxidoreductase (luciferase family) [Brevibacillus sp. OAP136]
MEIGLSTFVERTPDVQTGEVVSHAQRLREVVEEIVLADQVGLDVFGVGEHRNRLKSIILTCATYLYRPKKQLKRFEDCYHPVLSF